MDHSSVGRREFIQRSATTLGAIGSAAGAGSFVLPEPLAAETEAKQQSTLEARYNGVYEGSRLNRVAFPMGGIGAGMICLEGTGAFSQVSIRNRPDVFNAPCMFAALAVKGPR